MKFPGPSASLFSELGYAEVRTLYADGLSVLEYLTANGFHNLTATQLRNYHLNISTGRWQLMALTSDADRSLAPELYANQYIAELLAKPINEDSPQADLLHLRIKDFHEHNAQHPNRRQHVYTTTTYTNTDQKQQHIYT